MPNFEDEVATRLSKARKDLDNLVRQRDGVEGKITRMEKIVAGLEFLTNGNGSAALPRSAPTTDDIRFMNRRDAVAALLRAAPGPMSTKDLLDALQGVGRQGDSLNGVSGVLSRLRSQRLAQPWGKRGFWIWAENAAATSSDGTAPSSGVRGQEVAAQ